MIACYVVTDIETDGPSPGTHSMRSFASAVVSAEGELGETFSATLEALPQAAPDPRTLSWFMKNPEAWENATSNPHPVDVEVRRYTDWLRRLPWPRIFVAHPLTFDGLWMDWYLRRFAGEPLFTSLFDQDPLFFGDGLDLPSFISGRLGLDYSDCVRRNYPAAWFDGHEHTHKALDDAMGYASVLRNVLRIPATQTARP